MPEEVWDDGEGGVEGDEGSLRYVRGVAGVCNIGIECGVWRDSSYLLINE